MNDLKYALRALMKSPVFAVIAVVTLALGIGLNTSMFSFINSMYLRPLPFEDQAALIRVFRATPGNPDGDLSAADYLDLRSAESGIGEFASVRDESSTISDKGGSTEVERSLRISTNFLDVLKVRPEIGRAFTARDELTGGPAVVIISDGLWKSRYAGSPDIIGAQVRVGGESSVIVGVLPAWSNDGRLIRDAALYRPLRLTPLERASRGDPWLKVIGRRKPGVTVRQSGPLVAAIGERVGRENPKADGLASWRTRDLMGSTNNSESGRIITGMLFGLSACVLMIACSNLANFVLARAIERTQELSVRSALGASLFRLVRPLLIESLLLAFAGGACALIVNAWCTNWISGEAIASGGSAMDFPLDWRVLGVAIGSSLATALVFGALPALVITRSNLNSSLKSGMRGSTVGSGHRKLRHFLVVAQFAMAMTLLAGASYLVRGAGTFINHHLGWDSEDVAVCQVDLPKSRYDSGEKILAFQRSLELRLRSLPGVDSAAVAYSFPYSGGMGERPYVVEGQPEPVKGREPLGAYDGISPDYFRVSGGRILAGRAFTEADSASSGKVSIISQTMATALFPDGNALGKRIRRADADKPEWSEVVGIAADTRIANFYTRPTKLQVYHPISQEPWQYSTFAVRVKPGALKPVLAALRPSVAAIDPDLAVENVETAGRMVELSSFDVGMLKQMLGAFAGLGLFLASLGIYGVIARTVAQRTPEIGIRMALGATLANIRTMILASGARLALVGSAIGLVGGIGITRLLGSVIPGLPPGLLPTVAASAAILAVVALLACYIPARTASRVNPVDAIRGE